MLVPIRPGDEAYLNNTGAVFHPQDESGGENVAYYEIQNTGDEITFTIRDRIAGLDNPVVTLYTNWGETDFDFVDEVDGEVLVSEQSGFDNDIWFVQVSGTSGRFTITQFDTNAGVDGTQAAWLPFIGVADMEV